MKNSGTFVRTLLPSDANNIISLLDFNQILAPYQLFEADHIIEHAIVLEDFQVKVGLFSLLEADWPETNALSTQAAQEAEQARIKKEGQKIYLGCYHAYGNGPWIKKGEEILQNKNSLEQPWALMSPFFSTNETALIDEDLKIGVRIESKAQGNGGLKGSDYLTFFGSWRKVTNIKKKDDSLESLSDRISALESLISVFGAPSATLPGSNGLVPAPPAEGGGFLLRGDRGWQNPIAFVSAVFASTIQGIKTFAEVIVGNKGFSARGNDGFNAVSGSTQALLFATGQNGGSGLAFSVTGAAANAKVIDFYLNPDPLGTFQLRRITDSYSAVAANVFDVTANGIFRVYNFSLGQSTCKRLVSEIFTINPPSIPAQSLWLLGSSPPTFTVAGAQVGDFCQVAIVGLELYANAAWPFKLHAVVTNSNTVSLYLMNDFSSALDLGSFQIRFLVLGF